MNNDYRLTAEQLDDKYNPEGGGEHPDYTREEWRWEVGEDHTLLGYWQWVAHRLSQEQEG